MFVLLCLLINYPLIVGGNLFLLNVLGGQALNPLSSDSCSLYRMYECSLKVFLCVSVCDEQLLNDSAETPSSLQNCTCYDCFPPWILGRAASIGLAE